MVRFGKSSRWPRPTTTTDIPGYKCDGRHSKFSFTDVERSLGHLIMPSTRAGYALFQGGLLYRKFVSTRGKERVELLIGHRAVIGKPPQIEHVEESGMRDAPALLPVSAGVMCRCPLAAFAREQVVSVQATLVDQQRRNSIFTSWGLIPLPASTNVQFSPRSFDRS